MEAEIIGSVMITRAIEENAHWLSLIFHGFMMVWRENYRFKDKNFLYDRPQNIFN